MAKYLIQNRLSRALMQVIDGILQFCVSPQKSNAPIEKILICNIAHFGDVVISTCLLPVLKKQFPDAKIGFLVHHSTRVVLENHPLVDFIHCFDHWYYSKWKRYFQTRLKALQEIREIGYSAAIDVSCYFPNAIPLIAQARIPHRIGYESGGFGSLLTSSHAWNQTDHYMGFSHLYLLKSLGIEGGKDPLPCYPLEIGKRPENLPIKYIVFHRGSSSPEKEWPLMVWKELAQQMNMQVIITGKGTKEKEAGDLIAQDLVHCLNCVDRYSWKEFVFVIQHAALVISSDTVTTHLAASQKVPMIILFAGPNSPKMWAPPYPECNTIYQKTTLN